MGILRIALPFCQLIGGHRKCLLYGDRESQVLRCESEVRGVDVCGQEGRHGSPFFLGQALSLACSTCLVGR